MKCKHKWKKLVDASVGFEIFTCCKCSVIKYDDKIERIIYYHKLNKPAHRKVRY